eukprot:2835148-Heterocapsa_arctica.AAC.1
MFGRPLRHHPGERPGDGRRHPQRCAGGASTSRDGVILGWRSSRMTGRRSGGESRHRKVRQGLHRDTDGHPDCLSQHREAQDQVPHDDLWAQLRQGRDADNRMAHAVDHGTLAIGGCRRRRRDGLRTASSTRAD